jgi:hypothetical protein
MKIECTFSHGLVIDLPDQSQIRVPACQRQDEPQWFVDGRGLYRRPAASDEAKHIRDLPSGTQIRLWSGPDYPVLFVIA